MSGAADASGACPANAGRATASIATVSSAAELRSDGFIGWIPVSSHRHEHKRCDFALPRWHGDLRRRGRRRRQFLSKRETHRGNLLLLIDDDLLRDAAQLLVLAV